MRAEPGDAPAWGADTAGCVRSGIEAMFHGMMRVLAEHLRDSSIGADAIFVTGGDAAQIMEYLPVATRVVPELVLYGLLAGIQGHN